MRMATDRYEFTLAKGAHFRQMLYNKDEKMVGDEVMITNEYLGMGFYGHVMTGVHLPTGMQIAIKFAASGDASVDLPEINRELQALTVLKHPSIPALFDAYQTSIGYLLIEEFIDGENMDKYARSSKRIHEPVAQNLIIDVGDALHYINQNGGVHRDVHAGNVMLMTNGRFKLIDFGHCFKTDDERAPGDKASANCRRPPERTFLTQPAGPASDVFMLGRLLYKCLGDSSEPFKSSNSHEELFAFMHEPPRETRTYSLVANECKDIVARCLRFDVAERITIPEMFQHPFIQDAIQVRKIIPASQHKDFCLFQRENVQDKHIQAAYEKVKFWKPARKNVRTAMKNRTPGPEYASFQIIKHQAIKDVCYKK